MNSASKSGRASHDRESKRREAQQPPLPSANARTIINLLLFIHLFCLGIVLFWQTNSSPVSVQLHSVPAGYLKPLHMDLAFDDGHPGSGLQQQSEGVDPRYRERSRRALLHFTHGSPLDDELILEFEYGPADSRTTITLPPPRTLPPVRRERFQRLAGEIARAAYDENARTVLAGVVSQALLQQLDVEDGEFRIVRLTPQTIGEAAASDEEFSNPASDRYRQTLIAFRVGKVGNTVSLSVIEQAASLGNAEGDTSSNAPAVNESAQPPDTETPRYVPRLGPVRPGGGQ